MTETTAWDTYSRSKPNRREVNAAGRRTWFNWTQYPDHGPGVELLHLGAGASVADLGCGKGGNVAHLASLGMQAVGVDVSPLQLEAARQRWGDLPGLELRRQDALDFMVSAEGTFDAVYSVFGAMWFTDPDLLLPAIRERLKPGGALGFSQRPPVEGCYGCQASYINRPDDEEPLVVRRWDYAAQAWSAKLQVYGYTAVEVEVIPPPEGGRHRTGTLLVRCLAPTR